ncbi:DUF2249 domain-containing protein [Bdellovibrio reynosensis]|uniref:DUF2249 domain-containing protein n=1 Tax=Bdellovibrio reynosensis TaxID=2835041 RepID=A0ABY4C9W0_9BACT|nr:DUF2249 domain-containing protein [Bdellovibrio reynosensis]UOF01524.1 DUF2249 domain-containing protein [Bdellovibrio reynosensis]
MKEVIIEAQSIPPQHRHAYIFEAFDNLEAGESVVIVNTHDPVPLLKQFEQNRANQFAHEYQAKGPDLWKLKLTKNKKEGCCGYCG